MGEPDPIHGTLLLAMASRETNLRNITGGGFFNNAGEWIATGEDRGLWQFNDSVHDTWLDGIRGCKNGEYELIYTSALPEGRVPGLTTAAMKAIDILLNNLGYLKGRGVDDEHLTATAIAAWNAGPYGALKGYREGDCDKYTTIGPYRLNGDRRGDYSKDVIDRRAEMRRALRDLRWGVSS